jgi:pectate lyase
MVDNVVMSRSVIRRRAWLRAAVSAAVACAAGTISLAASAVPVIPQAGGYGIEATAGRGGQVMKVTNLSASGPGSLRACVEASGPRVCVFEVSGVIRTNKDLIIRNPNITIAGQTAPSPGVTVLGAGLWVAASEVLVQHMRFRAGDDPAGPDPGNRGALKVVSDGALLQNVVIDHCSLSWGLDETVDIWKGYGTVTLSNNIISEGLHDSPARKAAGLTPAGYGMIVGPGNGRVTIMGNLFAHNKERNPLTRAAHAVVVNNVVYNGANMDVDLQSQNGIATKNSVIGNVFIRGADYARNHKPVLVRTDGDLALPTASRVYLSDNASLEKTAGDEWSVAQSSGGEIPSSVKSSVPPTWPAGMTRLPTDADVTLNSVLKSAGARPADRDSVDRRVVQSVRDRSGRIINCVAPSSNTVCAKNAGGWPTLAENRRTLQVPSNPNEVTASGYTQLEVWLHKMAAEVEGRSEMRPQPPSLSKQ